MPSKIFLHVLTYFCVFATGISIEYIQKEDGISFGNFYEREEGKFFSKLGSLLSNQTSQSIDDCYFKCVQHKKCLSVNVIVLDKSYYGCQLLNWAGSNVEDYLIEKTNSSYIQMKVSIVLRLIILNFMVDNI